jgi:hypothetical protein
VESWQASLAPSGERTGFSLPPLATISLRSPSSQLRCTLISPLPSGVPSYEYSTLRPSGAQEGICTYPEASAWTSLRGRRPIGTPTER